MPQQIDPTDFTVVVDAVERYPDGASIGELIAVLAARISFRSLQRRLATLVAEGRLRAEGKGRATRYHSAPIQASSIIQETPAAQPALTVTAAGETIRRSIRRPVHQRHPVGYQREFLESYRPNVTAYLSRTVRQHLLAVGAPTTPLVAAGTYVRQVYNRLLIDLSWNSSRLEGNTYSLLETERLLAFGQSATGKDARESQMILNHKAAIELMVEQAGEIGFNRYTLCNLHALLAENLLSDPRAEGRLRTIPVSIGGTVFCPLQSPPIIEECFDQILATAAAIADPFEQVFFAMVHLPYLQPFEDVNKRVSRFAANIPLIRQNLCPLSFVDVPVRDYVDGILGVYELNRVELLRDVFVWAYERSCARYAAVRKSLGEPDPFRMRYRPLLGEIVRTIIQERRNRTEAIGYIRQQSEVLPVEDRARLIEVAETEIMALHEGNFARYRVSPAEYGAWREAWH